MSFSVRIHHTTFHQCYDNVFNRVSSYSSYILQCFYRQGSGPILHTLQRVFQFIYITSNGTMCSIERWTDLSTGQWPNVTNLICSTSRRVFLSTWQWPNGICVYNVTTLKGDNLPLLWYLGIGEIKCLWNFSYPDHTHTLRLVSPWGRPGNPADRHTAQRGYPTARRLPPQSPQRTLASGRAYPWYPAYPASTQTTRLQDCKYCQPTESIMPRRGKNTEK